MGCDYYEKIELQVTFKDGRIVTEEYAKHRCYDSFADDYERYYEEDAVIYEHEWKIKSGSAQENYQRFIEDQMESSFDEVVKIIKQYTYIERD
jgi:hypothetical protein